MFTNPQNFLQNIMSACFRANSSTRSHWKPYVFPSGSQEENSLVEYFGLTKVDVSRLYIDANIIVCEEHGDSKRYAAWKIASSPVPKSEQVSSHSGLEPYTMPSLIQYLFEDGWGRRYFDEFIPEQTLQKLRFELDIDEKLVPDEANRHISIGFWIKVIFRMTELLLRPYAPAFNPHWVICSMSGPKTTTYHVILSNYCFSNSRVCLTLTRLIKRAVDNELFQKMVNENVCQPNACFRLLNCSKRYSDRIKRVVVKESFPELDYEFPQEMYRKGEVKPILHFMDELTATLITFTTGCDHIAFPE